MNNPYLWLWKISFWRAERMPEPKIRDLILALTQTLKIHHQCFPNCSVGFMETTMQEAERSGKVKLLLIHGRYLSLWQPPCLKTTICTQTSWGQIKYASLVSHNKSRVFCFPCSSDFIILYSPHLSLYNVYPFNDRHTLLIIPTAGYREGERINNWSALCSSVAHIK